MAHKSAWFAGFLAAWFSTAVLAQKAAPDPARAEAAAKEENKDENSVLEQATAHMGALRMRQADQGAAVERVERSLLTYGDAARSNQNGSLWAYGRAGRPLAIVELYQGTEVNPSWIHAITLTGDARVSLKNTTATDWQPGSIQIEPVAFADKDPPHAKESMRLRQMKMLARKFTAHEFWDPDNSRFELRLLVQPVHRYSDAEAGIQDGAVFVLAHGTNPEVILLVEAIGKTIEESGWHYSLARLGSAELHVQLDGKEIWQRGRTPGVVGKPTDPYWLFWSPVERDLTEPKE